MSLTLDEIESYINEIWERDFKVKPNKRHPVLYVYCYDLNAAIETLGVFDKLMIQKQDEEDVLKQV
jgi:hypothetical protein